MAYSRAGKDVSARGCMHGFPLPAPASAHCGPFSGRIGQANLTFLVGREGLRCLMHEHKKPSSGGSCEQFFLKGFPRRWWGSRREPSGGGCCDYPLPRRQTGTGGCRDRSERSVVDPLMRTALQGYRRLPWGFPRFPSKSARVARMRYQMAGAAELGCEPPLKEACKHRETGRRRRAMPMGLSTQIRTVPGDGVQHHPRLKSDHIFQL
jgi:hypothetical protein